MFEQNFAQGLELIRCINRARGIAGAVHNEHSGSGGDSLFQLRCSYFETLLDTRLNDYWLALCDENDVGIGNPEGGGYDDFIAWIDDGKCQVEETLLSTARNQNLAGSVIKSVVALELGDNGVLERSE